MAPRGRLSKGQEKWSVTDENIQLDRPLRLEAVNPGMRAVLGHRQSLSSYDLAQE